MTERLVIGAEPTSAPGAQPPSPALPLVHLSRCALSCCDWVIEDDLRDRLATGAGPDVSCRPVDPGLKSLARCRNLSAFLKKSLQQGLVDREPKVFFGRSDSVDREPKSPFERSDSVDRGPNAHLSGRMR